MKRKLLSELVPGDMISSAVKDSSIELMDEKGYGFGRSLQKDVNYIVLEVIRCKDAYGPIVKLKLMSSDLETVWTNFCYDEPFRRIWKVRIVSSAILDK